MKKLFIALLLLVVIVIGAIGGLLFTKPGNNLLKPYIQSALDEKLPVKAKVENFQIVPLNIVIKLAKDSLVELKGDLSPFSGSFDIDYLVKIERLEDLKPLLPTPLRGALHTKGKVKGEVKDFEVKGSSDIAKSDTNYYVKVENLNPSMVDAKVKEARLEDLLYMVYQPRFVKGALNADAKLTDLNPDSLKGDVLAVVKGAEVDRGVMKKSFGIDLPKTTIDSTTKAHLSGNMVKLDSKTVSNLLKANLLGDIDTKKLYTDLKYEVDIKRLELLKPLTKADIRGAFYTKGSVKGNRKKTLVSGLSNLAGSKTDYTVVLNDYAPSSVNARINGAKIEKLLYMLYQPQYAKGRIDSTIELNDVKRLSGKVVSKISGVTNPKVLKKEFDFEKALIKFTADQETRLKKGVTKTDLFVNSNVAKFTTKDALFDINSGKFDSKYELFIPDLNRLYFATKQKMRGKLKVTGVAKKEKDLVLTAHSDTLGGTFDAKVVNDDLKADLKNIKVVELTNMLYYPKVFDSVMNADLKYNLATKKGKLNANALNGRILPNQMTFLLKQMANFDITKEIYKKTTLTSDINDKKILSDLDMKSRLTHITSKRALLDMERNIVDAKLRIDIKGKPLYVKIKGNIQNPKVSLDAKALLQNRAKKELQKRLKGKAAEKVKGLLNMF